MPKARSVSKAADTTARTSPTGDGLQRKPGKRRTDGGLGYPAGLCELKPAGRKHFDVGTMPERIIPMA